MVDRIHAEDTLVDEVEAARRDAERLRWINSKIREAAEADLLEEADDVDDEDDPPPSDER